MYNQEKIKPYSEEDRKGEQVEKMFDNIAPTYDLLNHSLSLGLDRYWRNTAIDTLLPYAPKQILDVATGTGDFALLATRSFWVWILVKECWKWDVAKLQKQAFLTL